MSTVPVGAEQQIKTLGPGFFIRSHENTRYAWVDAIMSPRYKDTLQEVKRVPMRKPVGKYNLYNKITRSSGTSH